MSFNKKIIRKNNTRWETFCFVGGNKSNFFFGEEVEEKPQYYTEIYSISMIVFAL